MNDKLKWIVIGAFIAFLGFLLIRLFIPKVDANGDKINICHATSSESNPYEAIRVDNDGNWHGHQAHEGDFLYDGPTNDKGKPTKDGDEWCEENVPQEPTPTPTDIPKDYCDTLEGVQDEEDNCPRDVCPNLEGLQSEVPEGYHLSGVGDGQEYEQEICLPNEPTPTPEQPQGPTGNPPTFAGSSTNAPAPSTCTIAFASPVLLPFVSDSEGNRPLNWFKSTESGIDHQSIIFGYDENNLNMGVENIPADSSEFTLQGTDPNRMMWAQIWAWKNGCAEKSAIVDK